jgi:SAM-dependent methyltransferase
MGFTCNICNAECNVAAEGREQQSCTTCGSSIRPRALIALLSQEIFGIQLTLPEFPTLKGIRGLGMSDLPDIASRLAEKFDYTNTFYHQEPRFDVTHPDDRDGGRYDFILSSEVMEHVPPPIETAFATLHQMLKPDGLLLMTVPYGLRGGTVEHFPELHEYALATPGGRTVLVNRRRDGSIEMFDELEFHGGHGSTLEMRKFTEPSLRAVLSQAGFRTVCFAAQNLPEFGIEHAQSWSLPIAARNGNFHPPAAELAREYRDACRRADRFERDHARVTVEYNQHVAYHLMSQESLERQLAERIDWAWKLEQEYEERSRWALDVEREKNQAIADVETASHLAEKARVQLESYEKDLTAARAEIASLRSALWTRVGRKLGLVP